MRPRALSRSVSVTETLFSPPDGAQNGLYTFECFTHLRSVVDIPLEYAPPGFVPAYVDQRYASYEPQNTRRYRPFVGEVWKTFKLPEIPDA